MSALIQDGRNTHTLTEKERFDEEIG